MKAVREKAIRKKHQEFIDRHHTGKNPFHSEGSARWAASEASKKNNEDYEEYKCEICRWWHIGHRPTQARVEMLRRRKAMGGRVAA
jgi:hypothetical protein